MNNLVTRTISGIIFLVIMVAGIWFSEYSYAALFLFIMLSTMLEFHRMTIAPGRHIWARVLTLVSAVTLFSTNFLEFFNPSIPVSFCKFTLSSDELKSTLFQETFNISIWRWKQCVVYSIFPWAALHINKDSTWIHDFL